ncbi:pentatricopeptide repeat-containing protein-like [Iris pallida]|uniref:Pentatricopeptide repeat-containing protein-like n=1 Tax=Iris pallida TaxID=29817 RepID=A0AAX6H926_IRIPA|nr:pentatricopeptide repeat-containing protein-like [Iris pallida]
MPPKILFPSLSPAQEQIVEHFAHQLQLCSSDGLRALGRTAAIHSHLSKTPLLNSSLFLRNHLLTSYFSTSPDPSLPLQLLDEMPHRNVVSWSSSISGLVRLREPSLALSLFSDMLRSPARPNEFTLVSALHAASLLSSADHGPTGHCASQAVYGLVLRLGFDSNVFLTNAYLTGLVRSRRFGEAVELFEKCGNRDVVSWNSMMAGYLEFDCSMVWTVWCRMNRGGVAPDEFSFSSVLTGLATASTSISGVQVHAQAVKYGYGDDLCVGNSLVDMYLKNRDLVAGFRAFREMPKRDVVSWTQMAAGCLDCGQSSQALEIIHRMKLAGIMPNRFTMATAFNACASLASAEEGGKAHAFRVKLGDDVDVCVDNALLDMYVKCGSMGDALKVFRSMEVKCDVSWTTLIMGFAQNGLAREALRVYEKMVAERVKPNYITFISVLYACSQGGLVDEGWRYFASMSRDHGVDPGEDHYACMVDLLGKAGHIPEAEALIQSMPFEPGAVVWQTLLGACRLHGDVETGKRAASRAMALVKEDPSTYVMLSNIFADKSNWDGVDRVRELMGNRGVNKMPGSSWIETTKVSKCSVSQQGSCKL